MASLPSQHPNLSLHLTDTALTPLITSAHSQPQLEALTSLTTASLTSRTALARLGLGTAQRLMVEHASGPVVLHSFLNPESAVMNGSRNEKANEIPGAETQEADVEGEQQPESGTPMLVGVVVAATVEDAREARRAAGRLERVGREFQMEWIAEERKEDKSDSAE